MPRLERVSESLDVLAGHSEVFEVACGMGFEDRKSLSEALISLILNTGWGGFMGKSIEHLESLRKFATHEVVNSLNLSGLDSLEEYKDRVAAKMSDFDSLEEYEDREARKKVSEMLAITYVNRGYDKYEENLRKEIDEGVELDDMGVEIHGVQVVCSNDNGGRRAEVEVFSPFAVTGGDTVEMWSWVEWDNNEGNVQASYDDAVHCVVEEISRNTLMTLKPIMYQYVPEVGSRVVVLARNQKTGETRMRAAGISF